MDLDSGYRCKNAGKGAFHSYSTATNPGQIKKIIALGSIVFLSQFALAQFAQFKISGSREIPFFIAIDDSLVGIQSRSEYLLDSIKTGNHQFLFVTDSTFIRQEINLELLDEKKYIYELTLVDKKIGVLFVTESKLDTIKTIPPNNKYTTPKKPIKQSLSVGKPMPGLTIDSLLMLGNLKNYSGRVGCSNLIKEKTFEDEIKIINSLTFEKERLEPIKKLIVENCLKTDQLSRLLDFTEFDDLKLNILNLAINHLFDIDNLLLLEENFKLQSSKEKLQALLKSL